MKKTFQFFGLILFWGSVTGCLGPTATVQAVHAYTQLYCSETNAATRQILAAAARRSNPGWIPVCGFMIQPEESNVQQVADRSSQGRDDAGYKF